MTDIRTIFLTTLITIDFPVLRPLKKTLTQTTFGWERRETEGDQGGLRSDDSIITIYSIHPVNDTFFVIDRGQ